MRLRLYNRIQHDVVFRIGRTLSVDELGFAHALQRARSRWGSGAHLIAVSEADSDSQGLPSGI